MLGTTPLLFPNSCFSLGENKGEKLVGQRAHLSKTQREVEWRKLEQETGDGNFTFRPTDGCARTWRERAPKCWVEHKFAAGDFLPTDQRRLRQGTRLVSGAA